MANPYRLFQALLPDERVTLGDVISHNGDGTSTVEFANGERVRPVGQLAAIGKKALVRKGQVIGEAPALTQYDIAIP